MDHKSLLRELELGLPAALPDDGLECLHRLFIDILIEYVTLARNVAGLANGALDFRQRRVVNTIPADDFDISSSSGYPCRYAPRKRATWPILGPCVTHDDWIFGTLSR